MSTLHPGISRRHKLEVQLENEYYNKLVEFTDAKGNQHYGRVQSIGIEWEGNFSYTVTVNLDGKRLQSDYDTFIKTTKIL
jgi:hypothetical protein